MRIGIIGPNRCPQLKQEELEIRKNNLRKVARILAMTGFEILLTPDKDSLLELLGKEYLKNDGKKISEIVPLNDDFEEYLNVDLGEIISCGKWPNQPSKFNEECDVMFCVGYGGMVMAEIGFSGYYNPKKIYIINEFISKKLPGEIGLDIKYINLNELEDILKNLK
ncbi:MAG: hypothetical protein ACD_9C00164G0003 [uncultured bacterium]|nr:MAG: hypothetical protein ACD_9C00164G0003 [uncultured bacterium]HBG33374.1 hypothetical protein [Acholeplasmataceae bacterium]